MKAVSRDILITLILAVVIFFILQAVVQSFVIVGSSMEPNFQDGERLIINKVVYKIHQPERGEVIVFHPPTDSQVDYIKRVIALPGETVAVKDGVVYINDRPLDEPYQLNGLPQYTLPELRVPDNEYFVLGDNRNSSNDSHNGWTVPRKNIIGKVWLLIWPPGEWGLVPHYSLPEQLVSYAK
jgi:signal peptidase I